MLQKVRHRIIYMRPANRGLHEHNECPPPVSSEYTPWRKSHGCCPPFIFWSNRMFLNIPYINGFSIGFRVARHWLFQLLGIGQHFISFELNHLMDICGGWCYRKTNLKFCLSASEINITTFWNWLIHKFGDNFIFPDTISNLRGETVLSCFRGEQNQTKKFLSMNCANKLMMSSKNICTRSWGD